MNIIIDVFAVVGAFTVLCGAGFVVLVARPARPQESPGWDAESLERLKADALSTEPIPYELTTDGWTASYGPATPQRRGN